MPDPTDRALRAQYEAFPYPARDPRDEDRRLVVGSPGQLREIDHWVFGARRPASRPFRALFAGGGTGDGAIMLAAGLAADNRPGHVLHLDRSDAASAIARARAERRGLTNIAFTVGSLEDPPQAVRDAAPFDYVDCCGVLHHLPDPAGALRALAALLAPAGGLGLMVYAPFGRAGVYELQAALRLLAPVDDPPHDRLAIARRALRHLPPDHPLRANRNFGDHLTGGDAGLYDLLLNPRDRPYTVDLLAALVDAAGLRIATLIEPRRYDPAPLLPDPVLRARAASLAPLARAALAEALAADHATHIAYLRRADAPPDPSPPDPLDPDAVPVARHTVATVLADRINRDGAYPGRPPIPLPHGAAALLRLVDGERTVAALRAEAAARGITPARFDAIWPALFRALESANRLLFRPPP